MTTLSSRLRPPPTRVFGTAMEMENLAEPRPVIVPITGTMFCYFMCRRHPSWLRALRSTEDPAPTEPSDDGQVYASPSCYDGKAYEAELLGESSQEAHHPVADAFGFAGEYAEAASLRLPASAACENDTVLLEAKAGDRVRQKTTQVGGRIVARFEVIRAYDAEAITESDLAEEET